MSESNDTRHREDSHAEDRNKRYVIKDAVGQRHIFIAGEEGVTEEWIAILRHDENGLYSSNYHYYFRWNGREYVPAIMRSDLVAPEELEHYPSMIDPDKDAETLLIEREDREEFLRKYSAAMRSLTDNQLKLIRMRYQLGMSDAEIARLEGVSAAAIFNRWKKIRYKIKKFFE